MLKVNVHFVKYTLLHINLSLPILVEKKVSLGWEQRRQTTNTFQSKELIWVFVYSLGFFVPLENYLFPQMETSSLPLKGSLFCSMLDTLMIFEQWGIFSVPHQLWHRIFVYVIFIPLLLLSNWQWSSSGRMSVNVGNRKHILPNVRWTVIKPR